MALVKTIPEIVREQMNQAADLGAAQFIDSLKPIYASTPHGTSIHVGTCILLEWKARKYLLTAAHIIDENEHSTLYLGANGSLHQIVGNFLCTPKPNGDRRKDHYDFAWLLLYESNLSDCGQLAYISEQNILPKNQSSENKFHLALGYPNSKNKQTNNVQHSVTPRYMKYSSILKAMPELCQKMEVSGRDHLFLSHDRKHAKDSEGEIVNVLNPRGSSGGALIDMGKIASPTALKPGHEPSGHLAGMLIENPKHQDVLVAVRISVILETIDQSL